MDVEHKLEIFSKTAMKEAREKKEKILSEFKYELKSQYTEKEKLEARKAEEKIKMMTKTLLQRFNKEFIYTTNNIRHRLTKERGKLMEVVFQNVSLKIEEFRSTKQYEEYLCNQILDIKYKYDNDIKVYLSAEDSNLLDIIRIKTGTEIHIDQYSFLGGFKAIVQNGRLSIDKTILSGLNNEKESFNYLKLTE